jgi:hypothetical protein
MRAPPEGVHLLALASPVIGLIPYALVVVAAAPAAAISAGGGWPTRLVVWLLVPLVNLFGESPGFLLLWVPAAIAAIATGHIARQSIRRSGQAGHALAGAGLVLGYGSWALLMLGFVAIIWLQYLTNFGY